MRGLKKSSKILSRETIGLLLTLSLALIAYLYNLQGWLLEDDENKYIYAAWRVAEGEVPGRDFLIAQPPLFLYAGAIAVKLCGGPSLSALYALRCLSVMATIVTAVFVYLTARSIWNARAGWLATVIFLLSGQVFIHGRLFRPDMFMLTLTVASTYLFVHTVARQKRWLLVGTGFLFGAAATIKLFGFLAWGGCALYILHRFWVKETSMRDALADLLALGVPAVDQSTGSLQFLHQRAICASVANPCCRSTASPETFPGHCLPVAVTHCPDLLLLGAFPLPKASALPCPYLGGLNGLVARCRATSGRESPRSG
jgi:predicted membrane-bound mannosyltransferase